MRIICLVALVALRVIEIIKAGQNIKSEFLVISGSDAIAIDEICCFFQIGNLLKHLILPIHGERE